MNEPRCIFDVCWVGQCKAAGAGDPPMCENHRKEKCWCGGQAVRQFSVAGSMVCGAPLCAEHECTYSGHGMTGDGPHSKRGQEQFAQWKKHREAVAAARLAGARAMQEAAAEACADELNARIVRALSAEDVVKEAGQ